MRKLIWLIFMYISRCWFILLVLIVRVHANDIEPGILNPPALPAPVFTDPAFAETAPFPNAFTFSADGKIAAYISLEGNVQMIDGHTLKPLETISLTANEAEAANENKQPHTPGSVTLNHDGTLLAIGYMDGDLQLYSRTQKKVLRKLVGHRGGIASLVFSPDQKYLASGSDDQIVMLWNINSGKIEHTFSLQPSGNSTAVSINFTSDSNILVVNEWYSNHYDVDRGITLWDVPLGMEISRRDVASPNSDNTMRAGAALGGSGWLLTYTGREGQVIERLDQCGSTQKIDTGGYAETVAADSQGRWVAEASWKYDDGEHLSFTSVEKNKKIAALTLPAKSIALYPHPDGRSLVAILFKEVHRNGNENFVFGRDAETVEVGALYRVSVPEVALQSAPYTPMPAGKACTISEQDRIVQSFFVPQSPVLLPTTLLAPAKNLLTQIEAKTPNHSSVTHFGWPEDLFFDQANRLNVLHGSEDDAAGGIAIWDINTRQLVQSSLKKYFSAWEPVRLPQGWAAQSDDKFRNVLTDIIIYSPLPRNKEGVFPYQAISDSFTGNVFILPYVYDKESGFFVSGKLPIERYSADGKLLGKIEIKAQPLTYAARNNLLIIIYDGGNTDIFDLNSGTKKSVSNVGGYEEWFDESCHACGSYQSILSANGKFLQFTIEHESGDGSDNYPVINTHGTSSPREGPLLTPFPAYSNRGVLADSLINRLVVWDFDKAQAVARLPRQLSVDEAGNIVSLVAAISDDGKFVAVGSADGLIRVWDIDAHVLVGEAHGTNRVTVMAFNANKNILAAGLRNGNVLLLSLPRKQTIN